MDDHYAAGELGTPSKRDHDNQRYQDMEERATDPHSVTDKPSSSEDSIDFLQDKPGDMTYGRRLALYLASRFKWYNPYLGEETTENGQEPPSLAKAWAYFEHVTLDRHVVHESDQSKNENSPSKLQQIVNIFHKGDRRLNIAEPGERRLKTKLYNPLTTPLSQMGDYGLGYGLYFSTLRSFAILSFLTGLLNLPNLLYFASDEYSNGQPEIAPLLQGSAICTDQTWVPCPDCEQEYVYQKSTFSRWRTAYVIDAYPNMTGEWLNVTTYLDWSNVDPTLTGEILFEPNTGLFTGDFVAALNEDYGITITDTTMAVEGEYEIKCPPEKSCLGTYCKCQVLTLQDCYCKFGNVSFTNTTVDTFGFAQKNNCDGATLRNGFINMGSVFLFIIGSVFIRRWQDQLVVKFDEDEQTAQDYSISILNPPSDAYDPNEWKEFFELNFDCEVTVVTVDLDNDRLVQLLAKRREIIHELEFLLPDVELTKGKLNKAAEEDKEENNGWCSSSKVLKLFREYRSLDSKIEEVLKQKRNYPTSSVFVTFETEAGQREVLKSLSVGWIAAHNNKVTAVDDPRYLFRGTHVLEVSEPEEPSAIRWKEMNSSRFQNAWVLFWTNFACLVLVAIAYACIIFLYPVLPFLAPHVVTIFTSTFPMFAKALMDLENHRSESSRQKWLFIKIASFNILITTVLISVVNSFTASLDQRQGSVSGLIPVLHATFISQLGLTPILQMLDISGNLNRHVFAPRAKTQREMNRNFGGAQVFLAERYANLMKYLFLIVWYCSLYPTAFFMGSFALLIVYFVDRFSLMRSWARSPQLGTQISDFARNYFTPTALGLMAVLSTYNWSGFPFDDLCLVEEAELNPKYVGNWFLDMEGSEFNMFGISLFSAPNVKENITIPADAQVYKYCLQDFRAYLDTRSFPPLPRFQLEEWMTDDQEQLLNVYGWVAVAILAGVVLSFLLRNAYNIVNGMVGLYSPRGSDMGIPFSKIKTIDTYIPSHYPQFGYPFLLCDVTNIDPSLFSWTDPNRPHEYYDVTQDIDEIIEDSEIRKEHLFARVKHWPRAEQ